MPKVQTVRLLVSGEKLHTVLKKVKISGMDLEQDPDSKMESNTSSTLLRPSNDKPLSLEELRIELVGEKLDLSESQKSENISLVFKYTLNQES